MFAKIKHVWFAWGVYAVLFLLPWQTRYMYDQKLIGGEPWEYGTLSVYAVELLIAVVFLGGQSLQMSKAYRRVVQAMGLILVASFVSMVFSQNQDLALGALHHLIFASMLFTILLDSRVEKWQAMKAFCMGLIPPSVLGLIQVASGNSFASKWLGLAAHHATDLGQAVVETDAGRVLRAYGSFTHPNVFGGFLMVGLLCVSMLLVQHHASVRARKVYGLLIAFFSCTLVATFSRSAWLAMCFAIGVGVFFLLRKHRTRVQPMLPLLVLLITSFAISGLIFFQPLTSRFDASARLEHISVQDRLDQYAAYPGIIKQHWLVGVGIGNYTQALAELQPDQPVWMYQPIHNTILLMLAEVGLLGVLAAVYWASRVDRLNYAAIRKGSLGAVGGIMLGSVPLVIIFFDHYLWSNWAGLALLSFLMAMTLRLSED